MKKLKTLEARKNEICCQFTRLRDTYENRENAANYGLGFEKGVELVNKWNELRINDGGEYDSVGEHIPDSSVPVLFKHEGTLTFYFAGSFDGNALEVDTNMTITHWRYIEHP